MLAWLNINELTLSAQQFEQTQGNEVQARLKAGLNEEFLATKAGELRRRAGHGPEQPAPTPTDVQGTYEQPTPAPTPTDVQGTYEQPAPTVADVVTDLGYVDASAPSTAAPANSLGEGYTYDPQRQLFQQQDTGSYFSADGELVYQWDPQQGRYYDHTTQSWL